jgi:hypothetical protein
MRSLSNLGLLEVWERGAVLHPLDRALLALAMSMPGEDSSALAAWPLGKRNAALSQLRRACFGETLTGWIACPQCGERLEFSLDAEKLYSNSQDVVEQFVFEGRKFRPMNSFDLASVAGEKDEFAASLALLRACCLDSTDLDKSKFSMDELDEIGKRLAEADPLAEVLLDLECSECGNVWNEPFDIAAWLWTEIEARARRLLLDVHTLAAAYGWSESEVLSLSEPRRALYLEMVRA